MSKANVEMVRALWEPFKGVDCTAINWDDEAIGAMTERFWSPDIELRWSRGNPEARVYQGRDGVIQAFREWVEPFSEYYVEPLDFIEQEGRVIVPQRQWGIGGTSGIALATSRFSGVSRSPDTRSPGIRSTTPLGRAEATSEPPGWRRQSASRRTRTR